MICNIFFNNLNLEPSDAMKIIWKMLSPFSYSAEKECNTRTFDETGGNFA